MDVTEVMIFKSLTKSKVSKFFTILVFITYLELKRAVGKKLSGPITV